MKRLLLTVTFLAACASGSAAAADQPETVMITLRCKPGSEAALMEVLTRHYDTAVKLEMVKEGAPHVTLRATDTEAKPSFIEILTWRDASAPDSVPAAIQSLWQEMHKLVESRGGRPGLAIDEVTLVTRGSQP